MRRRAYLAAFVGGVLGAGCQTPRTGTDTTTGGGPDTNADTTIDDGTDITTDTDTVTTPTNAPATAADLDTRDAGRRTTSRVTEVGNTTVRVETLVRDLEIPWGAAYRDGDLYLTERPGRIVRVAGGNGTPEVVLDGLNDLRPRGEGGLLGLVFHPSEPAAYTYGTYAGANGTVNRVVRHDFDADWAGTPVLDGIPGAAVHDGGRLAIHESAGTDDEGGDRAATLFVTCGDAGRSDLAQAVDSLAGKVLRLTLDGAPHPDNPFDNEVFTYGHRNPEGLAFHGGTLYSTEHGPASGDEINLLEAGNNYGWPAVTGTDDGNGNGDGGAYTDPIASYTPTVAPASATFYDGPIADWQGDFFFGALAGRHLHRVRIHGQHVLEQERLFAGQFGRLRTAFTDPDGHLCVTTSNREAGGQPREGDDRVLRFRPA